MTYIATFLLIAFGLTAIIKPEFIWKVEHFFTVKGGEPTPLYLTLSRLGGILIMGIGVVSLIVGLVNG